jgi:ribosomal protein L40E
MGFGEMTFLFLAAIGTAAVGFVLFPVFSRDASAGEVGSERATELARLTEKKVRIYESIKDLDFEHEAGKVSDRDYQQVRGDYLSQAVAVVAAMDALVSKSDPAAATEKGAPQAEAAEERVCVACGQKNPHEARFCFRCGSEIPAPMVCSQCGTKLPEEARFCISCGRAIQA